MNKNNKKNLHQEVTEKIVKLLETALIWEMPWLCLDSNGMLAHNAQHKTQYNSINQLILSLTANEKSYTKNAWLTFNQVRKLGGKVLKGEKSSPVYYYGVMFYRDGIKISEDEARALTPEQYKAQKITKVCFLKFFPVFNVAQTEGLADEYYEVKTPICLEDFEKDDRAEKFIADSGAKIHIKASNRAFYNPREDAITLPLRSQFKSETFFYETALHELGHWTGAKHRLNRESLNNSGKEHYAFEELVAELFSAITCAELGFVKNIPNNSAYVQSWIQALNNDHSLIFKASKQAEKALEYIKENQQ